ncbi:MAG: cytochrome c1 [Zoogloeaceae bacterium]|jgi:ubiquinol-cytochrome c reductase cytochrome c1 subunit|nr:cytochrome c1 [Zoogloeaceae bacterium]
MKTMHKLKTLLAALLFAPVFALASESLHLDSAPDVSGDKAALQNGARLFVNYCLSCHGASALRYNRLMDLGLTEAQIKENLMFTTEKIGDTMTVAMTSADAKKWFGVAPPDLSLVARARASADGSGADWLYTYLRSFYRDETRPTGWNNVIFANVGMPHILFDLQGEQTLGADDKLQPAANGALSPQDYDKAVADLVGFLTWMSDPQAEFRKRLGVGVLIFLALLLGFAYALKKEYWKDVH